ncbi:hypothetical protein Tco_0341269 [Tanacetum coccineum]
MSARASRIHNQEAIDVAIVGTGNGMIKSLLDSVGQPCTVAYAMLDAVRGHKRSLDVATIWQRYSLCQVLYMFQARQPSLQEQNISPYFTTRPLINAQYGMPQLGYYAPINFPPIPQSFVGYQQLMPPMQFGNESFSWQQPTSFSLFSDWYPCFELSAENEDRPPLTTTKRLTSTG